MRINIPVTSDEHILPEGEVIISRADLKGRVIYANESSIEVSGFAREELTGNAHNIVRHPDMPAAAFDDLRVSQQSRSSAGN